MSDPTRLEAEYLRRSELVRLAKAAWLGVLPDELPGGTFPAKPSDAGWQAWNRVVNAIQAATVPLTHVMVPVEPDNRQYDAVSGSNLMWRHMNSRMVYALMISPYLVTR